jgi:hypothetical protein
MAGHIPVSSSPRRTISVSYSTAMSPATMPTTLPSPITIAGAPPVETGAAELVVAVVFFAVVLTGALVVAGALVIEALLAAEELEEAGTLVVLAVTMVVGIMADEVGGTVEEVVVVAFAAAIAEEYEAQRPRPTEAAIPRSAASQAVRRQGVTAVWIAA